MRGCRGGRKRRRGKVERSQAACKDKARKYKPYVPSLIMGNVRSLDNKMDELTALVRRENIFRECSLMCFTETWLHDGIPDSSIDINGFSVVRGDRRREECSKRRGEGLAVYVNNMWCHPGHVTVKERVCSPDIEFLAVGLRPYYMPREFSHAILITVYIPPSANATGACDLIYSVTAKLQTRHPDALYLISGHFNQASPRKHFPPLLSMWIITPEVLGR